MRHHIPMKILVFEHDLIWASRMTRSLSALGHEPVVRKAMPDESEGAEAAIVNLGNERLDPNVLVPRLHELGVKVIGHAGHKEKELHALGRVAGCDVLATNSELTFKIEALVQKLQARDVGPNN